MTSSIGILGNGRRKIFLQLWHGRLPVESRTATAFSVVVQVEHRARLVAVGINMRQRLLSSPISLPAARPSEAQQVDLDFRRVLGSSGRLPEVAAGDFGKELIHRRHVFGCALEDCTAVKVVRPVARVARALPHLRAAAEQRRAHCLWIDVHIIDADGNEAAAGC